MSTKISTKSSTKSSTKTSNKTPTKTSKEERALSFTNNSGDTISLHIDRVFLNKKNDTIEWYSKHIKNRLIYGIDYKLGYIERVDVSPVYDREGVINFYEAFVHFRKNSWNNRDPRAREDLRCLRNGETIKLVYESYKGTRFFQVNISTSPRPDEAPKPQEHKTRIVEPEEKVPNESYRPESPTYCPSDGETAEEGEVLENQ
tara:strand:- start:158 stop:763 length:606 start_codon:yes stop_codon:yes gene_type:complete